MVMATNYSINDTLKNSGLYSPSSKALLAAPPQSSPGRAPACTQPPSEVSQVWVTYAPEIAFYVGVWP